MTGAEAKSLELQQGRTVEHPGIHGFGSARRAECSPEVAGKFDRFTYYANEAKCLRLPTGRIRVSPRVKDKTTSSIATLTPRQLAVISARHWDALRLRWQEERDFWARLLAAAQDGDEEALSESHLHAKLLLSGTLVARSTLVKL
jgi:hypothetical protein